MDLDREFAGLDEDENDQSFELLKNGLGEIQELGMLMGHEFSKDDIDMMSRDPKGWMRKQEPDRVLWKNMISEATNMARGLKSNSVEAKLDMVKKLRKRFP